MTAQKTLLVNGLSLQNSSGWYVLHGHLESVMNQVKNLRVVLVARPGDYEVAGRYSGRVTIRHAPHWTRSLIGRIIYESIFLPLALTGIAVDYILQPSGYPLPFTRVQQLVVAQNPYPFVFKDKGGISSRLRNGLLRFAYLRLPASRAMVFPNSEHMRSFYSEKRSSALSRKTLYQGAFRGEHTARAGKVVPFSGRKSYFIAIAEAAPHKRLDLVILAFSQAAKDLPLFSLQIIGKIGSVELRRSLETLVRRLRLEDKVHFCGFITQEELDTKLEESTAYISYSECESFGIPAVQAQAKGTPVLVSDGTAAPEICGAGACVVAPGDTITGAAQLVRLATDGEYWSEMSSQAYTNSLRFDWEICSSPLVEVIDGSLEKKHE
ncbi:glycosyltransferase [Paracoccus tibetensis]|uniref:Glycosyltransferase involved in cell wall bisynthesis n=1 Tax=Paracoccus tibetensis TaxID=336292 RepID=A0A1G5DPX2_9RHOB|nr:glycosyltransferase [Paracoccus tibetensis]SCY16813.1 Glycosyltransferase involved in cell wall bisynthesis [Paracoccus tibetensis]